MDMESKLPNGLYAQARDKWQALCEAAHKAGVDLPADAAFVETTHRVFAFSDFIARNLIRNPELLAELLQRGDLYHRHRPADYFSLVENRLSNISGEAELGRGLCRIRRREMVRIAWRDLTGLAQLDETMADLSAFARACLEVTLQYTYRWQCNTYGVPRDAGGAPQHLVVIGMGKLGSGELNFSSDIDLIFAYPERGETDGAATSISNEEFFVRLCRKYVKLIGTVSTDGPLFRVDIRLRPYGDNGPLVMSFDNMEDYYQHQGREWERYAWIKARVVAGDRHAGSQLLARLKPFIYRRYLDYGAFESLRDMKLRIVQEVRRKGMQDNIKLGPGGIREIEFFGQTFQLLRGGVIPALQCPPIQEVLTLLARENYITPDDCTRLTAAYQFFRNTEHRLQEFSDQQTHQLPSLADEKERLAHAMGFPDSTIFFETLDGHRQYVHQHFSQILELGDSRNQDSAEASQRVSDRALTALWLSPGPDPEKKAALADTGYDAPDEALRLLEMLREDPATRALSPAGRKRLDRVIPQLLKAVGKAGQPMVALARLLDLVKTIQRRTAYLALLQENPGTLTRLVEFADASPWMISYLMQHPVLLDELLDPRTLFVPPGRNALKQEIVRRYEMIDAEDLEYQMEALRVFKQVNTLRVAAADITGVLPLMKVSDHLSDIAEIAVDKAVSLTWQHLVAKHGVPPCQLDDISLDHGFAVIAYGKLGGLELSYGSDLDLVFLHAGAGPLTIDGPNPIDTTQFFARLGQRVIHFMTARTPAGILYETDMRLRPSGASGLLVSHIDAWEEYQMKDAWTWEHQALVRARGICGDPALLARFEKIRSRVLSRPCAPGPLKKEVSNMRERMRQEQGGHAAGFHLKQGPGGMVDIEFLVQYIVLLTAHRFPQLLKWTDNVRQIQALAEAKIIGDDMAHQLRMAYLTYRSMAHRLSLQEKPPMVPADQMAGIRRIVTRFWDRFLG